MLFRGFLELPVGLVHALFVPMSWLWPFASLCFVQILSMIQLVKRESNRFSILLVFNFYVIISLRLWL